MGCTGVPRIKRGAHRTTLHPWGFPRPLLPQVSGQQRPAPSLAPSVAEEHRAGLGAKRSRRGRSVVTALYMERCDQQEEQVHLRNWRAVVCIPVAAGNRVHLTLNLLDVFSILF